jgi:hypothetical protein
MKSRVTKKDIQTMINLIKEFGYWSNEVRDFNGQFTYDTMTRLQAKVKGAM